jgi:hypothetical protein
LSEQGFIINGRFIRGGSSSSKSLQVTGPLCGFHEKRHSPGWSDVAEDLQAVDDLIIKGAYIGEAGEAATPAGEAGEAATPAGEAATAA